MVKKAAKKGHVEAQFILGQRYYQGDGFETDFEQSLVYLRLAAEQDFKPALFLLSVINEDLSSEPYNFGEAQNLYVGSAEQGFAPAQRMLGRMFLKDGWMADDIRMQEVGAMWSVLAMLRGDEAAEFDVSVAEISLGDESLPRVQIRAKTVLKKLCWMWIYFTLA